MDKTAFLKNVVTHLVNATFEQSLCRVCLSPINENSEDIFTLICKKNKEYCIADVLEKVCQIEILPHDEANVCADCFISASSAYKFYLTAKRSTQILQFYSDEIGKSIDSIDTNIEDNICLLLPFLDVSEYTFDYDLEGISLQYTSEVLEELVEEETNSIKSEGTQTESQDARSIDLESVSEVFVTCTKEGERDFFKQKNGKLIQLDDFEKMEYEHEFNIATQPDTEEITKNTSISTKSKKSKPIIDGSPSSKPSYKLTEGTKYKRREPMPFLPCRLCPVQYRFVSKLKSHMKTAHDVDLFCCKVCSKMIEGADKFMLHAEKHTEVYTCPECAMVFKKNKTLVEHMKIHSIDDTTLVCVHCGEAVASEAGLADHLAKKHDKRKKFTCHYCSKNYRSEVSFEAHLRKHEHLEAVGEFECPTCLLSFGTRRARALHARAAHAARLRCPRCPRAFHTDEDLADHAKKHDERFTCRQCDRSFVDARALLWHARLHSGERPYSCEKCDKKFVTLNRRNQHALTAHTAAARRCPLCPARFHLASMVNTHIKKVHQAGTKRRYRAAPRAGAAAAAAAVPPAELSVEVQHDLIDRIIGQSGASTDCAELACGTETGGPPVGDVSISDQITCNRE